MLHTLKIQPKYFQAVVDGLKCFEVRKNDRGYKVGDELFLKEFEDNEFTGRSVEKTITYILPGGEFGIDTNYVILGLRDMRIKLKNIDLTGVSHRQQYQKSAEEENEYWDALNGFIKGTDTKEHVIEEFFDWVQAELGILSMRGITAEEVMKRYPKHLEKLKNRPRKKV